MAIVFGSPEAKKIVERDKKLQSLELVGFRTKEDIEAEIDSIEFQISELESDMDALEETLEQLREELEELEDST